MIYYCDDCVNRFDCPENQEQYQNLVDLISGITYNINRDPKYHCYYSLKLKCDYWVKDLSLVAGEMES